jgi:membrane protease YdiL (CAAX protease family)
MLNSSLPHSTETPRRRRMGWQLTLFLFCFFVVWTLRATHLFVIDQSISTPTGKAIYSLGMKLLIWVLPAMAYVWWLRRANPVLYLGLAPLPCWRTWWPCLFVTGGFLAAITGVEVGLRGQAMVWSRLSTGAPLATCLSLAITPLVEEVLFRGLVLRELMDLTGWARANTLTSLLFVGIHLPHWLWRDGLSAEVALQSGGVFVFSLLAGWLFAKSRSVWPPALAHTLNNALAMLLHG